MIRSSRSRNSSSRSSKSRSSKNSSSRSKSSSRSSRMTRDSLGQPEPGVSRDSSDVGVTPTA
ncbi:hypothetical protein FDZ84_01785 [Saccharopolyspora sp. ASAGF58]|nr:hypothetical protein FDZ84_01785 [Saccharopolyspora sp. ASAGF58]